MIQTQQQCICDVCRLLDYDCSFKLCFYCSMCDAWVCGNDTNNWPRRIKAAIKRKFEPGYKGLQNYTEVVQSERAGTNN